jgi:acyl-coenzyme A synthetase/AMP-(fatty) acid ligase
MATQDLPLSVDRVDPAEGRGETRLPPADCWLDMRAPPLDLNGPTSLPYVPSATSSVERPIFDLFRQVVEESPDRIAVADNARQLSRRQIWNGACRLAETIAERATTGRPVGILLPNDALYPVAVLGCLAAARPCVLLDRHYPAERNLAIIRDAGLSAIVVAMSDRDDGALYPQDIEVITIDPAIEDQSALLPPPDCTLLADDPAVIVYTSGSSGEPKGIVLSQRAILHRAGQLIDSLHLSAADSSLPLGSPCTIAGIQQVLEALLAGALLVKLDLQRIGFAAVLDTISERHVTLLFATPSLLRALARLEGAGDRLASLRCVHPSGEVLLGADLDLLRRCLPQSCDILVVYGLTEAPAICQWFVPRDAGEEERARVAVGYRLPGFDCAVLDQDDRPVGFDETGELVIRSRYTALGEWQGGHCMPGRFRPEPADPSLRTLRTGDLVRVHPDGVVVVVGRKDRQVKIRGMRVEPYEVENILRRAPGVFDAAVAARHEGETPALVAFVVLRSVPGESVDQALRTHLQASLPPYMQPARIIFVAALPLLPGHKVDMDALLALDDARSPGSPPAVPPITVETQRIPHTPEEVVLCAVVGELVGALRVGSDDDFFQLGGHSLLAMQLATRVRQRLGRELPLQTIFDQPRLGALARLLPGLAAAGPALTPQPRPVPLPASFAQTRL